MNFLQKVKERLRRLYSLPNRVDLLLEAVARLESRLNSSDSAVDPRAHEFRVYSQWGEDGIIDHLLNRLSAVPRVFVEFGVENYTEANTLFLLKHRGWRGLVLDGSDANIASIRSGHLLWRYDLHTVGAFLTRENIDAVISRARFGGPIGLLSVDVDGNDYWIWEAIASVDAVIVVTEYNSLFGPTALVSTPYRPDFARSRAHASNMYYGASLAALAHLADRRGYALVAGNSAGNNAFFVKRTSLGTLVEQTVEQAYVRAAFREARSPAGEVEHLTFEERQRVIEHLPLVDVKTGGTVTLAGLLR